jgi:hypothetical protein
MQPREGHLRHVLDYLKHFSNAWMTFDDSEVQWRPSDFSSHDWSYFYCDATDTLPPNMPEPRGLEVQINCFVDANYAGNRITRHSHTGILIFVNPSPIVWYSKAQTTIESSTFGAEFIATRIAVDLVESLPYKL